MTIHQVPRLQKGATALAVTLLLLFASSITAFYLNRGLIFEQKVSANQLRSTTAFEMAEAGIEWATGMMNRSNDLDPATCGLLSTTNISFRRKYVQTNFVTSSDVSATTRTFPGCKVSGTTLTCSCPDLPSANNESVAALGAAVLPGFTVAFADVPGDPEAVRVISTGCTAQAGACKPATTTVTAAATNAATTGASDANATVSVILKLRPLLRAAPAATLTCGTSCAPGGSGNLSNTDPATNGVVIDAGSSISMSPSVASNLTTIDGLPKENAIISNDTALSGLSSTDTATCSQAEMFGAYFGGLTLAQYAAAATVINCGSASDCGPQLVAAYNDGARSFYMPNGISMNNSSGLPSTTVNGVTLPTLGGPTDGVTIVTPASTNFNGNIRMYGLVFANNATANDTGFGTADIFGAVIACRGYSSNGNGTISYLGSALTSSRRSTGVMVRVPGSWRDN